MAANLTQTTLATAANQNALAINVTVATNFANPAANIQQCIYVINPDQTVGELMYVTGVSGNQVAVSRLSMFRQSFYAGATIVIGPAPNSGAYVGALGFGSGFFETDPVGDPSVPGTYPGVPFFTPWLNATNGNQWLQGINGQWVPGFNNPSAQKGVTAAVASVAGFILPSGPLFHVTGALAITGITIPVGFAGGSFTIIPDGTFTFTNANNITVAGTAVVNRPLTFTYDSSTLKFSPSYV